MGRWKTTGDNIMNNFLNHQDSTRYVEKCSPKWFRSLFPLCFCLPYVYHQDCCSNVPWSFYPQLSPIHSQPSRVQIPSTLRAFSALTTLHSSLSCPWISSVSLCCSAPITLLIFHSPTASGMLCPLVPVINLVPQFQLILHCLLWKNGSGPFKYVPSASWHDVKLCQKSALETLQRKGASFGLSMHLTAGFWSNSFLLTPSAAQAVKSC